MNHTNETINQTVNISQEWINQINIPRNDWIAGISYYIGMITNFLEKIIGTVKGFIPQQYESLVVLGIGLIIGWMISSALNKRMFSVFKFTLFMALLIFLIFSFADGRFI